MTKGRGALHKQAWHVAKRIVFVAVALKRGARGRPVAHNIYLLSTSRPRHPQLWKDASFSDRRHNAVHLLWLPRPTLDTQARSRNTFITYYPPSLPHLQPQTSVDPPRPFESQLLWTVTGDPLLNAPCRSFIRGLSDLHHRFRSLRYYRSYLEGRIDGSVISKQRIIPAMDGARKRSRN